MMKNRKREYFAVIYYFRPGDSLPRSYVDREPKSMQFRLSSKLLRDAIWLLWLSILCNLSLEGNTKSTRVLGDHWPSFFQLISPRRMGPWRHILWSLLVTFAHLGCGRLVCLGCTEAGDDGGFNDDFIFSKQINWVLRADEELLDCAEIHQIALVKYSSPSQVNYA